MHEKISEEYHPLAGSGCLCGASLCMMVYILYISEASNAHHKRTWQSRVCRVRGHAQGMSWNNYDRQAAEARLYDRYAVATVCSVLLAACHFTIIEDQ
jgi:hypothetical protein